MGKRAFDDYWQSYNEILRNQVRYFDKDDMYFAQYKIDLVKKFMHTEPSSILEYGCGVGRNLGFLRRQFPKAIIYGCDISQKSLEAASKELPEAVLFKAGEKKLLGVFDLIFVANVFHHIPPETRMDAIQDIKHMLKQDGSLFIFEHNPYNPVTRHLVKTCPFDEAAVLLKPAELKKLVKCEEMEICYLRYTLFFPAFLKIFRFIEPALFWLPLGGQYFLQAEKSHTRSDVENSQNR
jgi:SAM-dependent methyltransferase